MLTTYKGEDWWPMECAPKDGNILLLRGSGYFGFEGHQWVGFWNGAEWQGKLPRDHYQYGWTGRPNAWRPGAKPISSVHAGATQAAA